MTNKLLISIFVLFSSLNIHAEPETVYPVSNGDIRPILALAAKNGYAKGIFVGKVDKQVTQQFGKAPVMIKAVRMKELSDGCPKIVATIYQAENPSSQQEIPFRVCPK